METINIYTKPWNRVQPPTNQEIEEIVGKRQITTDSEGNIEFEGKSLTNEEKSAIEALIVSKGF